MGHYFMKVGSFEHWSKVAAMWDASSFNELNETNSPLVARLLESAHEGHRVSDSTRNLISRSTELIRAAQRLIEATKVRNKAD